MAIKQSLMQENDSNIREIKKMLQGRCELQIIVLRTIKSYIDEENQLPNQSGGEAAPQGGMLPNLVAQRKERCAGNKQKKKEGRWHSSGF